MSCNVPWDWGHSEYDASAIRRRRKDRSKRRQIDDTEFRERMLLRSRERERMAVRTIWHGILAAKMRIRHE